MSARPARRIGGVTTRTSDVTSAPTSAAALSIP
jgi:hypothetical protein